METVYSLFAATARRLPRHDFHVVPPQPGRDDLPEGGAFSYGETLVAAEALRGDYAAAGYGHGHRVALLLGNRPVFFHHYLALNALGAGIVPVNPDYRAEEMRYQLAHSEAVAIVASGSRVDDVRAAVAGMDRAPVVLNADAWPAPLPSPATPPAAADHAPDGESEAALLYTSGTTGRPKGCIQSNFYHLNAGRWYAGMGGLLSMRAERERLYNPLPLYHMNALAVSAMAMVLTGGCLISPERFSPRRWWPDLAATGATIVHYLGVVPPLLLNQPPEPAERAHHVRFGLGAGVDPEHHRAFEERFGFPLVEVWGMTETGRIFADCHEPRQVGSRAFGRPLAGLEARVVDRDDRDVPVGEPGELLVRHRAAAPRHGFFSGYLKDPAATEAAWRGGWFHTGDAVRQTADGMLYFVERMKHIIRRSGENIAAAEVEAVLQAHPDIAQAAVLAVADPIRDEEVFACLVAMPGAGTGREAAEAIHAWCLERLAYFKAPGYLLFMDALPVTGTQKVQKPKIFPPGTEPTAIAGCIDLRDRKRRG